MLRLPTKAVYLANLTTVPTPTDDSICSICLEPWAENPPHEAVRISTECPHIYHLYCILPWFAQNNTCPQDRRKLFRCSCWFCETHEKIDVYAQTPRIAAIAKNILQDEKSPDRFKEAFDKVATEVKRVLELAYTDASWLTEAAIAGTLATGYLRRHGQELEIGDWAALCVYREKKLRDVQLLQQVLELLDRDESPIDEGNFLQHESQVRYTLDIPTLFGHAIDEYYALKEVICNGGQEHPQLGYLPPDQNIEISYDGAEYIQITITPTLKVEIITDSVCWFRDIKVDAKEESVLFECPGLDGGTSHLQFTFLRLTEMQRKKKERDDRIAREKAKVGEGGISTGEEQNANQPDGSSRPATSEEGKGTNTSAASGNSAASAEKEGDTKTGSNKNGNDEDARDGEQENRVEDPAPTRKDSRGVKRKLKAADEELKDKRAKSGSIARKARGRKK